VELAGGATSPTPDACGVFDDSCGNFVDCGGCNNPDQACGANAPNDHGGGATDQGVDGLCGGGCTKQNMQTSDAACGFGKPLYLCTNSTSSPPASLPGTCVTNGNPGQPSASWCCP
jgi:hypothetical protein